MTTVFKGYSLPDQLPDVILIKKGDLGGFVLEAIFGDVRKTAGFNGPNTLATVLNSMLLGQETMKAVAQAQQALVDAAAAPKKRGRKPKADKPVEANAEKPASIIEVLKTDAPKRKGGRPKGSKNKPKVNGAAQEVAIAA